MGPDLDYAPLQSPAELKAVIEAERAGTPFLVYRDGPGDQRILVLEEEVHRVTVGRTPGCDVRIESDPQVSRVHAQLERVGDAWAVSDDGLSRNGTYVNGKRVDGRQLLRDADVIRFGRTVATFRQPLSAGVTETRVGSGLVDRASLSDAQHRVLTALCRPFKDSSGYATPATNQQIADELFLSVDAVKTHLRALFAKFDIEALPQNQKRLRLVELALRMGVVSQRDL
jgi:pSer/pThr/pTyr-binding forkhead associated (FHA) protein